MILHDDVFVTSGIPHTYRNNIPAGMVTHLGTYSKGVGARANFNIVCNKQKTTVCGRPLSPDTVDCTYSTSLFGC